jgi:putative ABC transport system permease protein
MFKNYLKLAYRNVLRHKRYALLNIVGLAVGLAACLLMAGYVIHEMSFENMYPQRDRIFRVNGRIPMGGRVLINAVVCAPLGPAARESIPEVEERVRILRRRYIPVSVRDRDFREAKMFFAGQEMLDVFSLPFKRGNPGTALESPFTVVIDEDLARKYFGDTDPMGKTLRLSLGETYDFQVTGVMREMPSNTVLNVPMIASFATLQQTHGERMTKWEGWGSITTFVRLGKGADPKAVGEKITALALSHLSDKEQDASYYLQPLGRIYLENETLSMNNDLDNSGSFTRIYVFSAIALLILIIAAINFINLSTAKIAGRMKEVGIRKTCGAVRTHLINQFLLESLLLTTIAMGLGLLLFSLFKPRLDAYLGKSLNLALLSTPWILPAVAAMVLVVGLLAGSYPALFLSRFPAAVIFRSGASRGPSRAGLRRVLVGVQFFIASALIVCTLTVLKQVRYSETKDLGYSRENLIILRNPDASRLKNASIVKGQILTRTGALAAASLSSFPSAQNRNISTMHTEDKRQEEGTILQSLDVDPDFVPTLGLRLVSGRNFQMNRGDDMQSVLINQTAARDLGLEDPLGKLLYQGDKAFRVIGLLEDWNTNSIHSPILPTVVFRSGEDAPELLVRLSGKRNQEVISQIREIWSGILPGQIFDYVFVDDLHLRAYDEERRLALLLISFCELTVLVACLGIFGLAAYSTEQRTKEIGIRKVLGSSVSGIVFMLTKSYARWVLVANVFAWPAAYFVVNVWLQDFAYRTSIGLGPFLLAGFLALAVAVFSVIIQTLKAALSNPVQSLRYE